MLTKAENIAGYEKFTLDEVIYPDEDKKEEETVRKHAQWSKKKLCCRKFSGGAHTKKSDTNIVG